MERRCGRTRCEGGGQARRRWPFSPFHAAIGLTLSLRAGRAGGGGIRSPARPNFSTAENATRAECPPLFHLRMTCGLHARQRPQVEPLPVAGCRGGEGVNPLKRPAIAARPRRTAKLVPHLGADSTRSVGIAVRTDRLHRARECHRRAPLGRDVNEWLSCSAIWCFLSCSSSNRRTTRAFFSSAIKEGVNRT